MKRTLRTDLIGFRANRKERAKLQRLARATQRTPSDVLRRLLDIAEAKDLAGDDLRLRPTG